MSQSDTPLAGCTIIARNYLAHARTLAQSFRKYEQQRLYVLVVDELPTGAPSGPDMIVLTPKDIGLE